MTPREYQLDKAVIRWLNKCKMLPIDTLTAICVNDDEKYSLNEVAFALDRLWRHKYIELSAFSESPGEGTVKAWFGISPKAKRSPRFKSAISSQD